jgi:hypothetical protein
MDLRQLAPKLLSEAGAVAAQGFVFDNARPEADALDEAHQGERRTDYVGIVAEADGLWHTDAGAVGGRENGKPLGVGPARGEGRRGVLAQHELGGFSLVLWVDGAPNAPVLLDRPAAEWLNLINDEVLGSQSPTDPGLQHHCMVLIKHKRRLSGEEQSYSWEGRDGSSEVSGKTKTSYAGASGPSLCCYARSKRSPSRPQNAGLACHAVLCLGQRHPPTPTASADTVRGPPIQAHSIGTIYKLDTKWPLSTAITLPVM